MAMIVKGIVYEKEQRLKEVMKVMGLSNGIHWWAWFITCFIMMFASILLLLLTLKVMLLITILSPESCSVGIKRLRSGENCLQCLSLTVFVYLLKCYSKVNKQVSCE